MSFNSGIIALSDLLTYNNSVTNGVAGFQFPDTSPPNAAAAIGGGDFEEANDPHWKDPSSAQWNLTVERELTTNTTVRLSYTGQGAYHLPITVDDNQIPASTTPYTVPNNGYSVVDPRAPFQNWLLLMESFSSGTQSYQSGIAEVTHKEGHGLTFQGQLHVHEKSQRCTRQRRANCNRERGALCGGNCRPFSLKVRPRQRGGHAAPTLDANRHLPTAVRKGTKPRGTGIPESSHRRLEPEHGDDNADGSVAHAHYAGVRRSIEHQYDRTNHRRCHCTSGLRRQSHLPAIVPRRTTTTSAPSLCRRPMPDALDPAVSASSRGPA